MSGMPWDEMMRFGLGVLRLSPDVFWAATPRELAAAHAGLSGQGMARPLERSALERLMDLHPDGGVND